MLPAMNRVKFNCVLKFVFTFSTYLNGSLEARSASRVDGYWLIDRGIVVQFAVVVKIWSSFPPSPKPTDSMWGVPTIFQWVERSGREADSILSSSANIKIKWSYNSSPPYAFIMCRGTSIH